MATDATSSSPPTPAPGELIDRLVEFDGPPEQFLAHLVAVQCQLAKADHGVLLHLADGQPVPTAMYPPAPRGTKPRWLSHAVDALGKMVEADRTVVMPMPTVDDLYEQRRDQYLVLTPLRRGGKVRGGAAFVVRTEDPRWLDRARERVELTAGLLSLYEMRLTLQQRQRGLDGVRRSLGVQTALNDHVRFHAAAFAMVNQIASTWNAHRVSLGFVTDKYVKARAISHTEKVVRKMRIVQRIEAAMEECLDQDEEIVYPAPPDATFVCRAAEQLADQHGSKHVCALPMRRAGEVKAVLLIERDVDQPFTTDEVELLRLVCELSSARILDLYEHDRWFGARWAAQSREMVGKIIGPKYTWAKVATLAAAIAIAAVVLLQGTDHVEATFTVEATELRIVPAPFDGFLAQVGVEPNDAVRAGQTQLAALDTGEIEKELAFARAERGKALTEADIALRDGKTAERRMALADAARYDAQVQLLEYRLDKATITAPIDGVVLQGDLKRKVNGPVAKGDVLFEVAPIESLRALIMVGEDRVNDLTVGQTGKLSSVAMPGEYLPIVIERISPIAQVVDQQNVFVVHAKIDATAEQLAQLRPGMEGLARIEVGERSYAGLWTRDVVNWIRMKLWM